LRFIEHMRSHKITTPFHYVSLHTSPKGRLFHDTRDLPNTDRLSSCLVRLPFYFNISDSELDEVIARSSEFLRTI
jgi:dTDP-4-amino-4,6-dideoxygalactose transaminase